MNLSGTGFIELLYVFYNFKVAEKTNFSVSVSYGISTALFTHQGSSSQSSMPVCTPNLVTFLRMDFQVASDSGGGWIWSTTT